jgi:hypothetical protein
MKAWHFLCADKRLRYNDRRQAFLACHASSICGWALAGAFLIAFVTNWP